MPIQWLSSLNTRSDKETRTPLLEVALTTLARATLATRTRQATSLSNSTQWSAYICMSWWNRRLFLHCDITDFLNLTFTFNQSNWTTAKKKEIISSYNCEIWLDFNLLTSLHTYKVHQHTNYLGQRPFILNVIVPTYRLTLDWFPTWTTNVVHKNAKIQ